MAARLFFFTRFAKLQHCKRWSPWHTHASRRTHLKAARAWRMKTVLRQVHEAAAQAQSEEAAKARPKQLISWASCWCPEPFKRLAETLQTHWDGVLAGMLHGKTNAHVEAMNGLLR